MTPTRPRHSITETAPVQAALDELRAELKGERIDFTELVILGAREKTRELRNESPSAKAARAQVADWVLSRSIPIDVDAADEAKRHGLPTELV